MENKNIKENILDKIEREKLFPKASWRFFLNRFLLWVPAVLSILIGSMAVSAILFDLTNAGWEYYEKTHSSFGNFFFEAIPYVWIGISVIFGFLAIKQIRNTYGGYRLNITVIVLVSVLISVVIGAVAYAQGVGAIVDRNIGERLPFHTPAEDRQIRVWGDLDSGRISGEIKQKNEKNIILETFNGETWIVDTSSVSPLSVFVIENENKIRALGYIQDEDGLKFYACEVFPWEIRGLPKRPNPEIMREIGQKIKNERNPGLARIKRCSYEQLLR